MACHIASHAVTLGRCDAGCHMSHPVTPPYNRVTDVTAPQIPIFARRKGS
jgi:hypothetical protein